MGFFSEFKKAASGEAAGDRYRVAGRQVTCPHCGGSRFFEQEALLDGRGPSLLDLEWLGSSATVLVCTDCGRAEWFADAGKVERL